MEAELDNDFEQGLCFGMTNKDRRCAFRLHTMRSQVQPRLKNMKRPEG